MKLWDWSRMLQGVCPQTLGEENICSMPDHAVLCCHFWWSPFFAILHKFSPGLTLLLCFIIGTCILIVLHHVPAMPSTNSKAEHRVGTYNWKSALLCPLSKLTEHAQLRLLSKSNYFHAALQNEDWNWGKDMIYTQNAQIMSSHNGTVSPQYLRPLRMKK